MVAVVVGVTVAVSVGGIAVGSAGSGRQAANSKHNTTLQRSAVLLAVMKGRAPRNRRFFLKAEPFDRVLGQQKPSGPEPHRFRPRAGYTAARRRADPPI